MAAQVENESAYLASGFACELILVAGLLEVGEKEDVLVLLSEKQINRHFDQDHKALKAGKS